MYTIICASLLNKDLAFLNDLSVKNISSIIIAYPSSIFTAHQHIDNSIYICCPCVGQVSQRMFALKYVQTPYIIFIDDDIEVSSSQLSDFILHHQSLPSTEFSALGVTIRARVESDSKLHAYNPYLYRLLSIVEGASISSLTTPGSLSPLFFNKPHSSDLNSKSITPCSWISGGFIILPRHVFNLSETYYPYPGKAFSEDIYLSHFLLSKHIDLYYVSNDYIMTDFIVSNYSFANLRAKFSLLRFSSLRHKYIRFFLSYLIRLLSYLLR